MNYLAVSGLLTFFSSTACSLFVISSKPRNTLKVTWSLFSFAVGLWGLGLHKAFVADTPENALFWVRVLNLSAITIPIFFYHYVLLLTDNFKNKYKELRFYYIFIFIYLLVAFIFADSFVSSVTPKLTFDYYPNPGILYYSFPIIFGYLTTKAVLDLLQGYKAASIVRKTQFKYVLIGVVIGFSGGTTTFLPVFNINIHPVGAFLVPVYVVLVSYAIIRYRLMDMKIAVTRFSIFVAVYSIVLGLPFIVAFGLKERLVLFFSESWWLIPLCLSTVLGTIGPYIFIFVQKKAEDKLLEEQRQYQSTLRQASLGMGQIKDLKRLLNLIVHVVTRAVKIENCKIFLFHEDSKQFILKASKGDISPNNDLNSLSEDCEIVNLFKQIKEPIVYEEIKQRSHDFKDKSLVNLGNLLKNLDAALVVPSFIENKLIAIITLGRKKSSRIYSHDDLAVFSILANQSALAIENAMYYDDMKRTQEQLFKAEKMATIGTMADGLSHQINNRLHAMGFISGDILDTIKLKKKENILPETREILDEVQEGLERIQDNVTRGGEIVGGLLKYTRKGDQGFSPVDLKELIKAAMEMAQFKVQVSEFKLIEDFDAAKIPKIRGNFTQLQEVFFNLIDNAYDAMMQRKDELKEEGYQPAVHITAVKSSRHIKIQLQDNGMGVRKEDVSKMFTPFFTTKVSSKKGTGLGMYVIRQIIEENHGGQVNFISEYKNGSQTTILLPISHAGTAKK